MERVDSHQHFWQLSRDDYHWLTPELALLYKDFLPQHLAPTLEHQGISQTILVQAAATEEETHFLLEIAERTNFVAGVVGWIDMEDAKAITTLARLAHNPYFKGIRPMLQDIDDVNWILKDKFNPIFEFMAKKHLTFDALVNDVHLSNIKSIADRHPTLKIVIDHCAKPNLAMPPSRFWQRRITSIASCKNVYIKMSGLLTEAPQGQVDASIIQPYVDHISQEFGPNRIMWGSDWPVIKLNGDYDTWVELTQVLLNNYQDEEKRKIWADNARTFYQLPSY
ncbi:amidohydrolase [Colwellia sp. M166]|nr:amidohydrolase [Colwellia sp. M166]